jgi:DNA repair protein RadA/Sms
MKKSEIIFTCSHCNAQYSKWTGRCLECGKWSTIAEEITLNTKKQTNKKVPIADILNLSDVDDTETKRHKTNIGELNRVLGGGLVPGSYILLGGEPGIGKSTLSLQMSASIPNTLYFSGEESVGQIKMRAKRTIKNQSNTKFANETIIEKIIATIEKEKPTLAIIDSIQTVHSIDAEGGAGNITQIRATATKLMEAAKKTKTAIIVIGHVTKDGNVAGPRTLEHLVDTVLYLEGDRHHQFRILRAVKNRFGSTDEIGIFEMKDTGLEEIANPSEALLEERGDSMPGSIVTALMEGTRSILIEVQALVNKTIFGFPIRKASGFDLNRLHVLAAVLEKRAGLNLAQYDIHINIVGGMKAHEPAIDLAVCLAIASAYKDKALGNDLVVFGEVGLGGEIRSINFLEKRIKESAQLGMKRVITKIPKSINLQIPSVKITSVKNISEIIAYT